MTTITLVTFTLNSGTRLDALFSQISPLVDEKIVIDGFSKDDTVRIATKYGARIFLRPPGGWGGDPDRMFALSKARSEWILYLDDDELLSDSLCRDLRGILEQSPPEVSAFVTQRLNFAKARGQERIVLGPCFPDRQIRIYRRSKATYFGRIHELPKIDGKRRVLEPRYFIIHRWKGPALWLGGTWRKLAKYTYVDAEHRGRFNARLTFWLMLPLIFPAFLVGKVLQSRPERSGITQYTMPAFLGYAYYRTMLDLRRRRFSLLSMIRRIRKMFGNSH
jgi:glycosyltransferase involved in cell wall biosynthesis